MRKRYLPILMIGALIIGPIILISIGEVIGGLIGGAGGVLVGKVGLWALKGMRAGGRVVLWITCIITLAYGAGGYMIVWPAIFLDNLLPFDQPPRVVGCMTVLIGMAIGVAILYVVMLFYVDFFRLSLSFFSSLFHVKINTSVSCP